MKRILLFIFVLLISFCFGQRIKRKIDFSPGGISQYITEYDSLGRTSREILTSNEDTLIYQFEKLFYYDKNDKLKIIVEKHSDGLNYTIYYYDKFNSLYKSVMYGYDDKPGNYTLYKKNQTTDYFIGDEKEVSRVQTEIRDSLGNQVRFFGWVKYGKGKAKEKWDQKFVNEYSNDKRLIRQYFYKSPKELEETRTFEYNSLGLVTKEIVTPLNGAPYIDTQYRYEYY